MPADADEDHHDRPRSATVSGGGATATASGSLTAAADAGVWPIADGTADDARGPSRRVAAPDPGPELDPGLGRFLSDLDALRAALDADGDGGDSQADAWPNAAASLDGADGEHAAESRVTAFCGGVYRGQVVRKSPDERAVADAVADGDADWVPCGHGAWTRIADGRSVLGRWSPSSATCARVCGLSLLPGLSFEGEWSTNADGDTLSAVGVGLLALGAVFCGPWTASTPHGLGELVQLDPSAPAAIQRGWVRGLRCVRPCSSLVSTAAGETVRDARRRFPDQPQRGLAVAALALDRWRAKALQLALTQLRSGARLQSTRIASAARLNAVRARGLALAAESRAVLEELETQREAQRSQSLDMDELVAQSRVASDRRKRTRDRHLKRRVEALDQLELARASVQRQREAVDALEQRLDASLTLLSAARQAQADCHSSANELAALKRRVESETMRINALKLRIRDRQVTGRAVDADSEGLVMALGLPPSRPATAVASTDVPMSRTDGMARSQADMLMVEMDKETGENVCDVPGCGCGIPRDVFLRVASTLNGDE